VARKSDFPKAIPPSPWISNDGVELPTMGAGIPLGDKQLTTFCAQGATLPLAHAPGHANVRFWPDRDATPIVWFDGNGQPHNKMDGFVGLGEGVEPTRLNVMKTPCQTPSLLEVADALAYFAQRRWTVGTNPGKPQVKRIYAAFGAHEIRLKVGVDGGFFFQVPDASKAPL
jgi:hypothetical protein